MKLLRVIPLVLLLFVISAHADILGSASSFAVLGASTVTNTGPSVVHQDLGVSPGSAITGFLPGIVLGATHAGDAVAATAQLGALNAYTLLAGMPANQILTGQDLGGLTLTPGVYFFASDAQLTGTLTLNALSDPNALFVFRIGSTLTTASNSFVNVIGGANNGVYWQVGSSATLGTTTRFYGSIIADQSITLVTGATINCGRAIALNAAVTMDSNTVDTGSCVSGTGGGGETVPEPASMLLLGTGLVGLAGVVRRKRIR